MQRTKAGYEQAASAAENRLWPLDNRWKRAPRLNCACWSSGI